MRQLLFLSLLWKGINVADPSSSSCCRQKTVGGVPYTLVDEKDTSYFNCVSNCVYQRDSSPGGTRVCFGKGYLEVVCKDGSQTTPPPIITNSSRKEGNEIVVQINTYQPATEVLEIEVSAHKNYPKTVFLHHQTSEMSMQKSENVCQLTDLPLDFDVAETASQFTRKRNLVTENRYSLKKRESKLSFEKRSKLIPEIQGHCENAQMVKTRDFDLTQDQYEKFDRGEVIFLGDKPKKRQSDECYVVEACIVRRPPSCGEWGVQIPGQDLFVPIHNFASGGNCLQCNYYEAPCGDQCKCNCKCSSITDPKSLRTCHSTAIVEAQFKANGKQERQKMEWNRRETDTSFTFRTPTMVALFANQFGRSRQNNDKNPFLVKFGTDCHILPMPAEILPDNYVTDIQEITSGNDYTTEMDDLEKFSMLVDDGLQSTVEVSALHDDIKSQCQGQNTYNSVMAPITKLQSQNLKNLKFSVLETLSSKDNCKLQKAVKSKGSADWRYPNQDGPKLWVQETIHFVDELTCCQIIGSSCSCCDDNFPDADKCMADNGCGVKCVISGDIYTDHHDPSHFHVDNIFTHNKEETSYEGYWIAPDHTQGNFIINLGCRLTFHSMKVVNTHNQNHRDRSTKKFRLSVSKTQAGPWSTVLETTLEDSRQQRDPLPVQQIDLQSTADGQFLKFELLEWYGQGGGLQFFDINQEEYVEVEEITASSTYGSQAEYGPHFAIDGDLSNINKYFLHTNADTYSWVQLKLSQPEMIAGVKLFNRADCCGDRLGNLEIRAGLVPVPEGTTGDVLLTQNTRVGFFPGPGVNGGTYKIMFATSKLVQFITLQLTDRNYLHLNEVKVIADGNNEEKEGCATGWSIFQSKCYRVYSSAKTWNTAQEECKKEGANLASITDVAINKFVLNLADGEARLIIGGYEPTTNKYVWIDGSQWAYTNWDQSEPGGNTEHCAVLHPENEKWHDYGCDQVLDAYVCNYSI